MKTIQKDPWFSIKSKLIVLFVIHFMKHYRQSVEVIIVSWQTPLSQIILKWLGKHSWEIFRIIIVHMILALIWVIDYIWFQFINGFQECYKAISSVEMYILQHESCYNGRVVWIYREPNFEASSGTTCCT